jgi:hypothetical protein
MCVYGQLMTQYLPILNAMTTFIAALDTIAIEQTFLAVYAVARFPQRVVGRRPRGQRGARPNAQEREGAW